MDAALAGRLLIGLAAAGFAWALIEIVGAQSQGPLPCTDGEEREYIRYLALDAIDKAFQTQVGHLFDVWMKSPEQQPKRAEAGMQTAISAHIRARKDAMKWNPPKCS